MTTFNSDRPRSRTLIRVTRRTALRAGGLVCGLFMTGWLLTGCATHPFDPGLTGPFHEIGNFFLINHALPPHVRRVAMLPLSSTQTTQTADKGRESLEPILYGELSKKRLFEIVRITPEQLDAWTGKTNWKAEDELPANFLTKIRESSACDAILFSQMTYYQPYPPLAVGWRLLLVDSNDGQTLWSLDEIFDAGEPRVANSVRRFALENERTNAELTKQMGTKYGPAFSGRVFGLEWINSPLHFARYTANAAAETLMPK